MTSREDSDSGVESPVLRIEVSPTWTPARRACGMSRLAGVQKPAQQRTQTEATPYPNRTVLNRSLQLTFSTASGVHSHFCAASFAT